MMLLLLLLVVVQGRSGEGRDGVGAVSVAGQGRAPSHQLAVRSWNTKQI